MVLIQRICPPERGKAVIAVSTSTSQPALAVNDDSPFQLVISLSIASTTQAGLPITISTNGTVFAQSAPNSTLDTLARGSAYLVSSTTPGRRINLGMFRTNDHSGHGSAGSQPADLKQRPSTRLLTIPVEGDVLVTHDLPISRIFKHEQTLKPQDVVNEDWRLGVLDGYIGTTWWCWGDLEGSLKETKLSAWHEGMRPGNEVQKPDATALDQGEWIVGCDPIELVFENVKPETNFRFTE
ncbi:hypothetical protein MBLNU459_g4200t1 [Dothideomycetes sp. NU459]